MGEGYDQAAVQDWVNQLGQGHDRAAVVHWADQLGHGYDRAAVRHWVDELTAELAAPDQRALRAAIADNLTHGWQPTRAAIADLVAYATGAMSMAHYLTTQRRDEWPHPSHPMTSERG
jgi:hypothetical protein